MKTQIDDMEKSFMRYKRYRSLSSVFQISSYITCILGLFLIPINEPLGNYLFICTLPLTLAHVMLHQRSESHYSEFKELVYARERQKAAPLYREVAATIADNPKLDIVMHYKGLVVVVDAHTLKNKSIGAE